MNKNKSMLQCAVVQNKFVSHGSIYIYISEFNKVRTAHESSIKRSE